MLIFQQDRQIVGLGSYLSLQLRAFVQNTRHFLAYLRQAIVVAVIVFLAFVAGHDVVILFLVLAIGLAL